MFKFMVWFFKWAHKRAIKGETKCEHDQVITALSVYNQIIRLARSFVKQACKKHNPCNGWRIYLPIGWGVYLPIGRTRDWTDCETKIERELSCIKKDEHYMILCLKA